MSKPRRQWQEVEGGVFIDDRLPNVRMRMQKLMDGPHLPSCESKLESYMKQPDAEPVNFRRVAGELLGRFYDQAMDIARLHGCKGHRRSQGKILYLWRCRFDDKCPARLRVIREPILPQANPLALMAAPQAGSTGQGVWFNPHVFNPQLSLAGAAMPGLGNVQQWTDLSLAQAQAHNYLSHMGMGQAGFSEVASPLVGTDCATTSATAAAVEEEDSLEMADRTQQHTLHDMLPTDTDDPRAVKRRRLLTGSQGASAAATPVFASPLSDHFPQTTMTAPSSLLEMSPLMTEHHAASALAGSTNAKFSPVLPMLQSYPWIRPGQGIPQA
eukprot:g63743.t1